MFVGGVFVAAGGRGDEFDPVEELIGGIIFGGAGLLCAGVAYSQYRRRSPVPLRRHIRGVRLTLDREEARRGETVSATVVHTGGGEDVQVGLVCVERYDLRANTHTKAGMITVRQTNEANAYENWREIAPGQQELTFDIPRECPFSYEGECVSYSWRVSARQARRLRPDPRVDQPVWVSP